MTVIGFGNGYYRRAPVGGGGGGHSPHDWLHTHKNTSQGCVGGGGYSPQILVGMYNITTGEGELETLGYAIRSQILIQYHHVVVTMTSSWFETLILKF